MTFIKYFLLTILLFTSTATKADWYSYLDEHEALHFFSKTEVNDKFEQEFAIQGSCSLKSKGIRLRLYTGYGLAGDPSDEYPSLASIKFKFKAERDYTIKKYRSFKVDARASSSPGGRLVYLADLNQKESSWFTDFLYGHGQIEMSLVTEDFEPNGGVGSNTTFFGALLIWLQESIKEICGISPVNGAPMVKK